MRKQNRGILMTKRTWTTLDLRLCTCTHLVKLETSQVLVAVCDAYVKYGMNVFEHEHSEKLRIREEEADELSLGQAEGDNHKKGRPDPDRRAMTVGVSSGERLMVTTDSVTTRQRR